MELAEASGLSRLPEGEPRSPIAATTEGTGEILRAVLDAGVRHVLMGVGGSATTDGGSGLLRALGVWYRGGRGRPLPGPDPRARRPSTSRRWTRGWPSWRCESPAT